MTKVKLFKSRINGPSKVVLMDFHVLDLRHDLVNARKIFFQYLNSLKYIII